MLNALPDKDQKQKASLRRMFPKSAYHGAFGPALTDMEASLGVYETNEPINRREGNIPQADLERDHARSIRSAMKVLGRQKAFEMTK